MLTAPKKAASLWNWGGLVGALITFAVAFVLAFIGWKQKIARGVEIWQPLGIGLINASYDMPFVYRDHLPAREAVIVFMDETSIKELEQSPVTWSRKVHADLIRRLAAENAKAVVMDITFFEKGAKPEEDAALAAALKENGKVVLAALAEDDVVDLGSTKDSINLPIFRDGVTSGLCNLSLDSGYFVRRFYLRSENITEPTLAERAAQVAGYLIPERSRHAEWMNYVGPPEYIPWVSYFRVLRNEGTAPDFFKDKVVFVGYRTVVGYMSDQRDAYETPYTTWNSKPMSGVEIHATQFLNLVQGSVLKKLSAWAELFLFAMVAVGLGWGLTLVRPLLAALIAIVSVIAIAALSFMMFKSYYWWSWVIAAGVQAPVALAWAIIYNTVRLHVERKSLERSLALHLSPKRAKQLAKNPALLQVGAERHEISILFSDIANFSTITARMHPEDLFKLLNQYFQTALTCVYKTDGTVVKLIGDAIFSIWNAPMPQENPAKAAVTAALQMRDQLVKFDTAQHSLPLQTRIGLHQGDAFVGNVGSADRFDYTAIGDNINLASRLEGLNKYLGTMVLGTRDIQRLVERDFSTRLVGHFVFKGIDRPVEVYEFLGGPGEGAAWSKCFAEALFDFQRKNFEEAAVGFKKTIEMRDGSDGPSKFYLEQIDKISKTQLPETWAGEVRLTEK